MAINLIPAPHPKTGELSVMFQVVPEGMSAHSLCKFCKQNFPETYEQVRLEMEVPKSRIVGLNGDNN